MALASVLAMAIIGAAWSGFIATLGGPGTLRRASWQFAVSCDPYLLLAALQGSASGPRLPSLASTRDGSYRGISCRLHPSISNAIASRGDCGQNDPSSTRAHGAISDSST